MINNLPKKIPVFPLSGVIYFPKTKLPLNIFEQRYLDHRKHIKKLRVWLETQVIALL